MAIVRFELLNIHCVVARKNNYGLQSFLKYRTLKEHKIDDSIACTGPFDLERRFQIVTELPKSNIF